MDFMSRGPRQTPSMPSGQMGGNHNTTPERTNNFVPEQGQSKRKKKVDLLRLSYVTLLFSVTVIILAVVVSLMWGGNGKGEAKYVNKNQLQAVFLNGGQVYFGHIQTLNNSYIRLTDIFYLRINQTGSTSKTTTTNNNVSLVKLGCELHGPVDEMMINNSQVQFWENLRNNGQVAEAVANYVKQHPNGQKCTQPSNSTKQSSPTTGTTTQPATGTSTKK